MISRPSSDRAPLSTARRLTTGLLAAASLSMLFTLLMPGMASAHRLEESYIYVNIYEDAVEGRLEFNVTELNEVLDLGVSEDDFDLAQEQLDATVDQVLAYAEPRFGIGAPGTEWKVDFAREVEVLETESGIFGLYAFEVDETFDATPTDLDVRYEIFFDTVEDHVGLFHIESYWEGGLFANENNALNDCERDANNRCLQNDAAGGFLSPFTINNTTETFDLDDPDFWRGFRGVVDLGVEHIRIGTDHILFVVVLLLPSVLVFSSARRWEPATSFGSALWRVLKIATAFTVAHSITLTLAGLNVIELNSKLVETIIAISIIAAAIHNLRPVVVNREWAIAFGFGLFHGLGFAGLLGDLGLDRTNKVWSLVGFNIGVEIGQIAIILLVFPTLYVLRSTRLFKVMFPVASIGIAVVAFLWMLERIFEVYLRVNRVIDPFIAVPRAYYGAVLVFLAAVAWRAFEERQGWLEEPPAEGESEPERELVDA